MGQGGDTVGGNDTKVTIWGSSHLRIYTGTFTVYMLGADCGDFSLASDGSVVVPLFGNTIGGVAGVVKLADLVTFSTPTAQRADYGEQTARLFITSGGVTQNVFVPIVIGLTYRSLGQRLRPALESDVKSATGPALGKTRRTHQYAALVLDGVQASFGTVPTLIAGANTVSVTFPGLYLNNLDPVTNPPTQFGTFSGVYWNTLIDQYSFDSMFTWEVERPWPLTIRATSSFVHTQER